jgi:eukaryotic-like serine/threonine-protein kinase
MKECQLCKTCFADDVATCPNDGMPTFHSIPGDPVLEGKYMLDRRLGQGGMGIVYKARHSYLKTLLAIKVILPDLVGNDPQLVTRFRQEALAAAAIRHQNVVSVTDYGVIDGTVPFLVMEYVDGESLHDLLAREKALSPERALELMAAICAGVGAAHHQGIVHRDLKPLNIMVCSDKPNLSQAVKILDFGLAKIKSGELLGSFIQAQTTGLMGSPYYMAPEQWADEEPDSRSDIYSLGVMLYQMLAGDVPFKGTSIPAIMKKHISDPPPTLADAGLNVSPELETAILHALQKDKNKRTPSVDVMIEELTSAIIPMSATIPSTIGQQLPVSSLKIVSKPPQSSVFVDNVSVGQTRDNGALLLEGVQSGNHHLRISHGGYRDWLGDVICDGKPQEVVAELSPGAQDTGAAIPRPDSVLVPNVERTNIGGQQTATDMSDAMAKTVQQDWQPDRMDASVATIYSKKKRKVSPVLLGIVGIFALFMIGGAGLGAAYYLGFISLPKPPVGNTTNSATPSPAATPAKVEMAMIPGGSFKMGRNSGRDEEKPEHDATVKDFWMDKTEVTNAEYYQFVKETNYRPTPSNWEKDMPLPNEDLMPVRYVSIDDANAFAAWRSKRDGVTYRLPTEAEWEYAARNGAKDNLYPWGDKFDANCAVVDQSSTEPKPVGSHSCPNDWGVQDLIGNVYEWTGTRVNLYPGSAGTIRETKEQQNMIRGGAALNKSSGDFAITATFRAPVPVTKRDKELGFRLVREK